MVVKEEHPIKIVKEVMQKRYESLQKLNGGSKKSRT